MNNYEEPNDVIDLILEDHQQMKPLVKVLKDSSLPLNERLDAFDEFAPMLVAHSRPEEETIYRFMKRERQLREDGVLGETEHILADQVCEEVKRAQDEEALSAKMKVLGELVWQHLREEETTLLPDLESLTSQQERDDLGEDFLDAKTEILSEGADEAPPERLVKREMEERSEI